MVIWDEATFYDSHWYHTECKYSLYITDTRDKVLYGTKKSVSAAKVKISKGAGKVKIKVGSLKSKKTYYVRVYPYKKSGGKTYTGITSAVKKVKTK